MDTTNPLDPRFGRVPLSSTTSSSTTSHNHLNDTNPLSRVSSHRRVQSETFHRLPEDFLFDLDTDFSLGDVEFPSLSDENGGNSEFCKPSGTDEKAKEKSGVHLRSLSVDAAMFEGLGLDNETVGGGGEGEVNRRVMHKHSCSMDGSSSLFEPDSMDFVKKAMAADKLAELALLDPKRAKRILANRQSAARSKERKVRHMSELERKVQTLQTEATTLSAQLTLLQRDTTDLINENKELKLRLQAIEQQAHLRDALNQALREEVQRLKLATGQIAAINGNTFNTQFQQQQQYFPHRTQELHELRHDMSSQTLQQQPQQQNTNNHKNGGQSSVDDSMDFMLT